MRVVRVFCTRSYLPDLCSEVQSRFQGVHVLNSRMSRGGFAQVTLEGSLENLRQAEQWALDQTLI